MCLHRGCGKRRSQKCRKCEGQGKVGKHRNLLPELVAVAVTFRLQYFLIAAAMGHRYENSAHQHTRYL